VARLLELAEAHHWRYVNLGSTDGKLPANVTLRGALVKSLPTDPLARELQQRGIPVVRLGSFPHPDDDKVPAVLPDTVARGLLAAEHFAQRDFEHVAYVGRRPWANFEPMYNAYAARAEELGCRCHLLQEDIAQIRSQGPSGVDLLQLRQDAFTRWLGDVPKPIGLFTFNDPAGALYCQWIIEAGLRVPEDVAVLGMGNNEFVCQSAAVPLSSIAPDHRRHIEAAVDLLVRLIAGEKPAGTPVMIPPVGVVTRQSTDVLAASDPTVVKALRFMWDHVSEDLSVDQIARHVGVSRRTLERAFRQDMDRGVNEELKRRRLEKAREVLVQTDWKITQLVKVLHFSSSTYFCRAFRQTYGISPAQYRRRHGSG